MIDNFIEQMKLRAEKYRPLPFWSFNDNLEKKVLSVQIEEMKKQNLGGYFMHARSGLETPYLSDEWFSCIEQCIKAGNNVHLRNWVYDENGWPSGFGDGLIPLESEDFTVKWLEKKVIHSFDDLQSIKNLLGVYSLYQDKVVKVDDLKECRNLIAIYFSQSSGYIDILNKDCTDRFIQTIYEKYRDQFGNKIEGFFTDEPQYGNRRTPWSCRLQEEFFKAYGGDILDDLPLLFFEIGDYRQFRYKFFHLVSQMLVNGYYKKIFTWCEENQYKLTGHAIEEDKLQFQMPTTADIMSCYEFMQIPGIDWLGRRISSSIPIRQCSSVSFQLGKEATLSETFALCGWNVSFDELKWIAEWQFVNGVNLICQHLQGYSLRGARKRDYPPSLFIQQPSWQNYGILNDYFAKLGALISKNNEVADILVLSPIKTAFCMWNEYHKIDVENLNANFENVIEQIESCFINYHLGSENIIKRYGEIQGNHFIIKNCSYKTVVLPYFQNIDRSTLMLLEKFHKNGGEIIGVESHIGLVDGEFSSDAEFLANYNFSLQNFKKKISLLPKNFEITAHNVNSKLKFTYRKDVYDFIFIVNLSKYADEAQIKVAGKSNVAILDLVNEKLFPIDFIKNDYGVSFKAKFEGMQSFLFLFDIEKEHLPQKKEFATAYIVLNKLWHMERGSQNVLLLDKCTYQIDQGELQHRKANILIFDELLKLNRDVELKLIYDFYITNEVDLGDILFGMETPNKFDIWINGKAYDPCPVGYFIDSSIQTLNIGNLLQPGNNEIILKTRFTQDEDLRKLLRENALESETNKITYQTELENIYILGDFSVKNLGQVCDYLRDTIRCEDQFFIDKKTTLLQEGNFTNQGYFFFSGNMTLCNKFSIIKEKNKRYFLKLKKHCAAIHIFCNDILIEKSILDTNEVDLTDCLVDGENKLGLQIFSTNRNLFGPHHHISGENDLVGPSTFTDVGGWCDDIKENIWIEDYCFTQFGFEIGE